MSDNRLKSQINEYFKRIGAISSEFYGKGTITYDSSPECECQFGAIQLSNGDTYIAVNTIGKGSFTAGELHEKKFVFTGKTEDRLEVTVQREDIQFLIHMKFSADLMLLFLLHRFKIETGCQNPVRTIRFGLTNFLFWGNHSAGNTLSLNVRNFPTVLIHKLDDYKDIEDRLQNKKSIEITSELVITLDDSKKFIDAENLSLELCYLLSICRGSKIFWIYHALYDKDGIKIAQIYCNTLTLPLPKMPELLSSVPQDVNSTIAFIERAYETIQINPILRMNLHRFSNVFVEARDGRGFIESRGLRMVVLMEMLAKYVLENPDFDIKKDLLSSATQKETKKAIINGCKEVILSNLPTSADIRQEKEMEKIREYLINNLSGLNHTPFKKIIETLCEKIELQMESADITQFVISRNSLIHTGNYYFESRNEEKIFWEYSFLINFLDKVLLKLFNYSGTYQNFKKWGEPSLNDII